MGLRLRVTKRFAIACDRCDHSSEEAFSEAEAKERAIAEEFSRTELGYPSFSTRWLCRECQGLSDG